MRRCFGECKKPYTLDFTPEVIPIRVSQSMFGAAGDRWATQTILHDTTGCPDRIKWRMNSLRQAAQRLRHDKEATDGR